MHSLLLKSALYKFSVYYCCVLRKLCPISGELSTGGGRGIDLDLERGNSKCHTTEFKRNSKIGLQSKPTRGYFGG